jgi:all-trans-retinol dehydrogenase (NAD+)
MSEIRGSSILITGAASGIGRLVALEMAHRGGELVLWDLRADALDATAREIEAATGRLPLSYACDVSCRETVRDVAARTLADAGRVDVLINNAGVVSGRPFLELTDEAVETTFAVNTLALFWTTKQFLPGMIQRGRGHLVTVASASSLIGVARLSDYAASKWAAMGFDESLRVELRRTAPYIRTTVVCPFYINTGMFHGVRSRHPWLLPLLEPQDVADAIVRAVDKDRISVVLPWAVRLIPLMRMLPPTMFDRVADLLGVNSSMDEFTGRSGGGH